MLKLMEPDGKVVNTVKSGFDGFYLFEEVPFGNYRVRPEPGQLLKQSLPPVEPRAVAVSYDHDIVSGIDFSL